MRVRKIARPIFLLVYVNFFLLFFFYSLHFFFKTIMDITNTEYKAFCKTVSTHAHLVLQINTPVLFVENNKLYVGITCDNVLHPNVLMLRHNQRDAFTFEMTTDSMLVSTARTYALSHREAHVHNLVITLFKPIRVLFETLLRPQDAVYKQDVLERVLKMAETYRCKSTTTTHAIVLENNDTTKNVLSKTKFNPCCLHLFNRLKSKCKFLTNKYPTVNVYLCESIQFSTQLKHPVSFVYLDSMRKWIYMRPLLKTVMQLNLADFCVVAFTITGDPRRSWLDICEHDMRPFVNTYLKRKAIYQRGRVITIVWAFHFV